MSERDREPRHTEKARLLDTRPFAWRAAISRVRKKALCRALSGIPAGAWMAGTSPAMTQDIELNRIVIPGLVPGIHGTPAERQPLLNSRVFPHPARSENLTDCSRLHVLGGILLRRHAPSNLDPVLPRTKRLVRTIFSGRDCPSLQADRQPRRGGQASVALA